MAGPRTLKLTVENQTCATELVKVTREDLYGDSKLKVEGEQGQELQEAIIPMEGDCILAPKWLGRGMKIEDEFSVAPVKYGDAVTGKEREPYPSSFTNQPQFLKGTPEDVLTLQVDAVYHLPGVKLSPGEVYKGAFNYRSSLSQNRAVIIANVHGAFLLIGKPASTGFVGLEEAGQIIAVAEAEQTEEDIFSSMV